jgi:hypothetical protein
MAVLIDTVLEQDVAIRPFEIVGFQRCAGNAVRRVRSGEFYFPLEQSRDLSKGSRIHCPRDAAWNERFCSIFWRSELRYDLLQFCFHESPLVSTLMAFS